MLHWQVYDRVIFQTVCGSLPLWCLAAKKGKKYFHFELVALDLKIRYFIAKLFGLVESETELW